jgi:transcriptional regulator with XRE-family HTH domain
MKTSPTGFRLMVLRRSAGYSQVALSEASGVAARVISDYETGRLSTIYPKHRSKLAAALGLPEAIL